MSYCLTRLEIPDLKEKFPSRSGRPFPIKILICVTWHFTWHSAYLLYPRLCPKNLWYNKFYPLNNPNNQKCFLQLTLFWNQSNLPSQFLQDHEPCLKPHHPAAPMLWSAPRQICPRKNTSVPIHLGMRNQHSAQWHHFIVVQSALWAWSTWGKFFFLVVVQLILGIMPMVRILKSRNSDL